MIFAVPAVASLAGPPGSVIIRQDPPPPPIASIRKLGGNVDWSGYVPPPDFAGYAVRYGTAAGQPWGAATALSPTLQTATFVPLSAFPASAAEALVEPIDQAGQRSGTPARQNLTVVIVGSYPSGLAWASGLSPSGDAQANTTNVDVWGRWRGRAVDIVNVKCRGRRGEGLDEMRTSILAKGPLYAAYYAANIRIEQVVIPVGGTGDTLVQVAGGSADAIHTDVAKFLGNQQKRRPFVIRLGHEMEATANRYSPWLDPDQTTFRNYRGMMQRLCDIYHRWVGAPPDVYIDWCHLRSNGKTAWTAWYPGDSYIDCIGMDTYCTFTAQSYLTSDAGMQKYLDFMQGVDIPGGPRSVADWARSRGKKSGHGEWAVSNQTGAGTVGDNTWYINGMFDFFAAYSDTVLYESYFNVDDVTIKHNLLNNSGSSYTMNAYSINAARAYLNKWKP